MSLFDKFAQPEAVFAGEYDCRENCFMRLYENTTAEDFEKYINNLTNSGFSLLQRTEREENLFALLSRDITVSVLFTPCDGKMRITAQKEVHIPCLEKKESTGDCTPAFFAFESDHTVIDCGMCLLVQCSDYSFFIVDSGHYFQFNDNDRIYKLMRERTPDGQKVVVNGWLITHAHTDHISKLLDFLKYNTYDVVIEGFYQNLLPADYKTDDIKNHEEREMAQKLFYALEKYPAPVYKLHTGMRFFIREMCFDVLYTHEDAFPDHIDDYNDSSSVIMLELHGSRIFIPGDAAVKADEVMRKRYSSSLKCDIVQVAHHGHTGLSSVLYTLLGADAAVFPVTRIFFEEDLERRQANKTVVEISKEHFVTSDGTAVFPLPYEPGKAYTLPDETFEDFEKIKRIWRYIYTDDRKDSLYALFIKNGGKPEELVLPTSKYGWIEPKPPIGDENG